MGRNRSRSTSSSSSSSSSSSDGSSGHGKLHKSKKHGKKHDNQHTPTGFRVAAGAPLMPHFPQHPLPSFPGMAFPSPGQHHGGEHIQSPPLGYGQQAPPPSGYRRVTIPLTTDTPFPPQAQSGPPPCFDGDRTSPVYFGSALFGNSVHPCKVAPHLAPTPCRVPYGGGEHEHKGRYDLLPLTSDMELVPTSGGHIPPGRRPIEGGYEEGGQKLYHAVATIDGIRVPGKCGEHLYGANVAYGCQERYVRDYEILCWKH